MNWLRRKIDYEAKCTLKIEKYIALYRRGGVRKYLSTLKFNHFRKYNDCLISNSVKMGNNIYIAHPNGIIIRTYAELGNNISIYPGAKVVANLSALQEKERRRYTKIGDGCILCANCTIVGSVDIGKNCIIAAGAVITKDIPDNSIVVNANEIRKNEYDNVSLQKKVMIDNNHKVLFYNEKLLNKGI